MLVVVSVARIRDVVAIRNESKRMTKGTIKIIIMMMMLMMHKSKYWESLRWTLS